MTPSRRAAHSASDRRSPSTSWVVGQAHGRWAGCERRLGAALDDGRPSAPLTTWPPGTCRTCCMQYACVRTIMAGMGRPLQIRNVPEPVHEALKAKAEAAGMSLAAYALRVLEHDAHRPSLEKLLARVEQRKGGRVHLERA